MEMANFMQLTTSVGNCITDKFRGKLKLVDLIELQDQITIVVNIIQDGG